MKTLGLIKKIFLLLIATVTLVACSKGSDNNEPTPKPDPKPEPKPNPEVKILDLGWAINPNINQKEQHYITFYTQSTSAQIEINAIGKGWVDLNNNGLQDEDEQTQVFTNPPKNYTFKSAVVTFYGNFTRFIANKVKIKNIDLSHSPALKTLSLERNELAHLDLSKNIALSEVWINNNQIKEEAMLAIAQNIPKKEINNKATIFLQSFKEGTSEANKINEQVLDLLTDKNWEAKFYERDEYKESYDDDPFPMENIPTGDYGIYIGSKQLTATNYWKITSENFPALESGVIRYKPKKRILILNGVSIKVTEKDTDGISQTEKNSTDLTIVLQENNKIYSKNYPAIAVLNGSLKITGNGTLNLFTEAYLIKNINVIKDLTIEGGCSIESNGQIIADKTLVVNRSNVYAKGTSQPAMVGVEALKLLNCRVDSPKGTSIKKWQDYFFTFMKSDNYNYCTEIKIVAN